MPLTQQDYEELTAAGVPLAGNHRPAGLIDYVKIATVFHKVLDDKSDPKTCDAIRGWLIALRDHYPAIFATFFTDPRILATISSPITGRDIKLRRMALKHIGKFA